MDDFFFTCVDGLPIKFLDVFEYALDCKARVFVSLATLIILVCYLLFEWKISVSAIPLFFRSCEITEPVDVFVILVDDPIRNMLLR